MKEVVFESQLSYKLGCIVADEVATRVAKIDFAKVDDKNTIKVEGDEISISIFKELLSTNLNSWRYTFRNPLGME